MGDPVLKQGRVRLPADVLAKAGIAPGSLVILQVEGDRIVLRQLKVRVLAARPDAASR